MEMLNDNIKQFIQDCGNNNCNGCGSGYGYGNGYGYGDSFGNGGGNGCGDSNGKGYGRGYGGSDSNGCGDSDGKGYGCGYGGSDGNGDDFGYSNGFGYGDSFGNGDSDAYGYCISQFEGYDLYNIDGIDTAITAVHGNYAQGFTVKFNSIKVPCYIAKVDGYFAHGYTLHEAVDNASEKAFREKPLEERIASVVEKYPNIDIKVDNAELYKLHNFLTSSCEFGRREFCKQHGIDLDGSMTIRKFINLTEESYGGAVIMRLREEGYKIKNEPID